MPESVLPGVTIDVRAEGLIIPGRISVGTVGVVGTASKGPLDEPRALGSAAEARAVFGDYDPWPNPGETGKNPLTLVRTLELAFNQGAQRAIAVRISGNPPATKATIELKSSSTTVATVSALSAGVLGNSITVSITKLNSSDPARRVVHEDLKKSGDNLKLSHDGIVPDGRTRLQIIPKGGGAAVDLTPVFDTPPDNKIPAGQVLINMDGKLTFNENQKPGDGDQITATYVVGSGNLEIRRFTASQRNVIESFLVFGPRDLQDALKANSTLVEASVETNQDAAVLHELPTTSLANGTNNGIPDFANGLEQLLDQDAHIILAAGQGQEFAGVLAAHCSLASSDAWQRERIGIIGTKPLVTDPTKPERADPGLDINPILSHDANSDRVILVGPGLRMTDSAADPPVEKVFPAAFTAAAFAGLLSSFDAEISPTNKPLSISGLEVDFTRAQLEQLVSARVTAIERRQGFLVVKGITTSTNTAFAQITTRRIADFARIGVRSAALPYIGLLNNERVRSALRATVNSFLTDMVNAEMLTEYQVTVTATRDEEIKGIARVTLTLRPTFSIDFIQVTIFLQ